MRKGQQVTREKRQKEKKRENKVRHNSEREEGKRRIRKRRGCAVMTTQIPLSSLPDGVSYLSSAVMGMTAKPTKMMMEWMNDQIAPAYWVPNAEIHACRSCTTFLSAPETKHHCRLISLGEREKFRFHF